MRQYPLIFYIIYLLFFCGCASCQFAPDKDDFNISACYHGADCLYRNRDNKDKSVCADYISECNSFSKYLFCLNPDNRPDNITFKECWLYLNQK
jgi:hypothetical protein